MRAGVPAHPGAGGRVAEQPRQDRGEGVLGGAPRRTVDQPAGHPVDDGLGQPARAVEGHRRGAVRGGLDHGQPPALLERGHREQPGLGQHPRLDVLLDVAEEVDPVGDAEPLGLGSQLRLPPAVADDGQPQVRQLPGQPRHRGQRDLDPLVRHEPTEHDDRRVRRALDLGVPRPGGAVVHDGHPVARQAQRGQLVAGDAGDGDVGGAAVQARREPRLDGPADPRHERAEDDAPLLAVDVVDEHHDRRACPQPGQERHAVLHVDHDVGAAEATAQAAQRGAQIDRGARAAAHDAVAVADLVARRAAVVGAEEGDAVTARGQPGGDGLGVDLGATALGVGRVAPVEQDDVERSRRGRSHRPPPAAVQDDGRRSPDRPSAVRRLA